MKCRPHAWLRFLAASMGMLAIAPAFAELEEIVVTAQRREEDQQKVPISIATATAGTLDAIGVRGTDELGMVAPGLTIQRQIGSVLPYIRGIGNPNTSGGQESSVALYVDGFYYAMMPSANFSLNNIERIEVLRGPQGTLFGRNATGGLIQVVTKDPSHEPSARVGLSYDDYDTIEGNLYATGGLGESFAADIAFYGADQGEGYGTNVTTGQETLKREESAVRSTLLFTPTEQTTVRVGLDYVDTENSVGIARQAAEGALTVDGVGALPDYYDIRSNYEPVYQFEGYGVGAKVTHEFPEVTLVSLTGWRDGSVDNKLDQDSTPLPLVDALISDDTRTFSQELQLLSKAGSSFEWIAGLYYLDFDVDYGIDLRGLAFAAAGGAVDLRTTQDTTSWAAYAQTAFPVWEGGRLTLGLRYTDDERKFSGGQFLPNRREHLYSRNGTAQDGCRRVHLACRSRSPGQRRAHGVRNLQPRLQERRLQPGQRQPGPRGAGARRCLRGRLQVRPAGRSSAVERLGVLLRLQDLQQQVIFAGLTVLSNAATAEVLGGELELIAVPTDNLEVRVGVSVLDSEYTDYPGAQMSERNPQGGNFICTSGQPAPSPPNCPPEIWPTLASQTATGNELSRAPDFTVNLAFDYTIPTTVGDFGIAAGYFYNDGFFWEADNRLAQDSYGLLNANLSWQSDDGRYRAFIFGKNLTDEEYSQFVSGGTLGDVVAPEPPLTYGVGFSLNFE